MIFYANRNLKRAGGNHTIRKNKFKSKTITRDREGHYVMIKGSIYQKDRMITSIYNSTLAYPNV